MNTRVLLGVLAAAAVVGSVVIRGDEVIPQVGDSRLQPEKIVALRDGGSSCAAEYRSTDGGLATRITPCDCVRRLADAGVTACRRVLEDGGAIDFGALNRFPADASVGTRCQRVACSVYAGEDADEEESVKVARQRDGGQNVGR